MELTTCTLCKKQYLSIDFRKDKRKLNGLRSWCKYCERVKSRDYNRSEYKNNRDAIVARNTKWKREHPEYVNKWGKIKRDKLRIDILTHYGNGEIKCACCGETEIRFMALDHVNNDGAEERKKLKSGKTGYPLYVRLKKLGFPVGFQVLCHNCNMAKGFYGECPHTKET